MKCRDKYVYLQIYLFRALVINLCIYIFYDVGSGFGIFCCCVFYLVGGGKQVNKYKKKTNKEERRNYRNVNRAILGSDCPNAILVILIFKDCVWTSSLGMQFS